MNNKPHDANIITDEMREAATAFGKIFYTAYVDAGLSDDFDINHYPEDLQDLISWYIADDSLYLECAFLYLYRTMQKGNEVMKDENKISAVRISANTEPTAPDILNGKTPQEFLASFYDNGDSVELSDLLSAASIRYKGFSYNFNPYLNFYEYSVGERNYKAFAPNKKMLKQVIRGKLKNIKKVSR